MALVLLADEVSQADVRGVKTVKRLLVRMVEVLGTGAKLRGGLHRAKPVDMLIPVGPEESLGLHLRVEVVLAGASKGRILGAKVELAGW